MKYTLARFISFIFHPVFFTVLIPFLVIYRQTSDAIKGLEWSLFSSLFLLLTIVVFFFLQPVEFLTDFDLSNRKKRPVFYSITLLFAVLFFITAIIFKGIFFPLSIIALGIILGIVLFELVNFYLKVSIHSAIASAYVVTVFVLYGLVPAVIILWIPFLVVWSRLVLKRHTKAELIAGAFLGSSVTLATFALAKILL
ncbi:MAG: hypothetical protein KGJ07_05480 [Patescibacteria group bacterium]|nr:hypothetical protein [Patescibacteria group bacterium]MDE2588927.1 hypothetical protein [Patescibacteria group bacterium]